MENNGKRMASDDARQLTADRVGEMLRRRILSGELAPGERLREMEIARGLGTSQAPVREALKELETRELVVTEAYKGTYVRRITRRDMVEAYYVRASLEDLAGTLAAPRLNGNLGDLLTTAACVGEMANTGNVEGYAHEDHELHRAVVKAAGNRLLLRSWDALAFETRIEILLRSCTVDLTRSIAEHEAILHALDGGHGKEAGKLLRAHSLRFAAMLEKS